MIYITGGGGGGGPIQREYTAAAAGEGQAILPAFQNTKLDNMLLLGKKGLTIVEI